MGKSCVGGGSDEYVLYVICWICLLICVQCVRIFLELDWSSIWESLACCLMYGTDYT